MVYPYILNCILTLTCPYLEILMIISGRAEHVFIAQNRYNPPHFR